MVEFIDEGITLALDVKSKTSELWGASLPMFSPSWVSLSPSPVVVPHKGNQPLLQEPGKGWSCRGAPPSSPAAPTPR